MLGRVLFVGEQMTAIMGAMHVGESGGIYLCLYEHCSLYKQNYSKRIIGDDMLLFSMGKK